MAYRDDLEAALERATALARDLDEARGATERAAALAQDLAAARATIARLEAALAEERRAHALEAEERSDRPTAPPATRPPDRPRAAKKTRPYPFWVTFLRWLAGSSGEKPFGTHFGRPLWLFGHEDAERWLVPPRAAPSTPVVVMDLGDPRLDGGALADRGGDGIVDGAAFVLAERIWMETDTAGAAAVWLLKAKRKFVRSSHIDDYDGLAPFLRHLEPSPVAVWGDVARDPHALGCTLRIRRPGAAGEETIAAAIWEAPAALIHALVRREVCAPLPAPAWYRPPLRDELNAYGAVLEGLFSQIADKNRLVSITPRVHARSVELARGLQERGGPPQAAIMFITAAMYAQRAGCLNDDARRATLETVRTAAEDHPLHRLAPHIVATLGEAEEARRRRDALRAGAPGAYRAWLDRLAL